MVVFITIKLEKSSVPFNAERYRSISVKYTLSYFGLDVIEVGSQEFATEDFQARRICEAVGQAKEYISDYSAKTFVLDSLSSLLRNPSDIREFFG